MRMDDCSDPGKTGYKGLLVKLDRTTYRWIGYFKSWGGKSQVWETIFEWDSWKKEATTIYTSKPKGHYGQPIPPCSNPFHYGLLPKRWNIELSIERLRKRPDYEHLFEWFGEMAEILQNQKPS